MINKDSASSKPSVNNNMAKIRRHGKWSSYKLHTQESAPERPNLKVYTSDDSTVFWTCIYKMKPGCKLHTNCSATAPVSYPTFIEEPPQ